MPRVDPALLRAARETDPTDCLEAAGYTVQRQGRHLSARGGDGDEVYRVTRRQDGRWLWCDRGGAAGGDNVALVQVIEPGLAFAEAVARLCGGAASPPRPLPPSAPSPDLPQLPPPGPTARDRGRAYLRGRGISTESILHAEEAGFVRYADGGVFFIGYDEDGRARSAPRRATDLHAAVPKRELRGSDKGYPPILPGDPSLWIVEGGVDALALHDLARRAGKPPPTALVSGGAAVIAFFGQARVQELLRKARRVVIAGEHEKSPEAQARADGGHLRQAVRVAEITGHAARIWKPNVGKDLAELNFFQYSALWTV